EIAEVANNLGRSLARRALGLDHPARILGRKRRALHAMPEPDPFIDAVLGRGLAHIVQDAGSVGDRLRIGPRLERIAEREHVAVGADAGIAEKVPRAANCVAGFEDDEALRRAPGLQMVARANAGKAGADDEDVEMFCLHSAPLAPGFPPPRRATPLRG